MRTTPMTVDPEGPRTAPVATYSGTQASIIANTLSLMEASTTWPPRPCAPDRCSSAITAPNAACMPASESPSEIFARTGASPGHPAEVAEVDVCVGHGGRYHSRPGAGHVTGVREMDSSK